MKYFLSAVMVTGWLCLAMAAFAQSTSAPQPSATPSPMASPEAAAGASGGAAAGGGGGKRASCTAAAKDKKGQDRQDEFQLCMAQGHLDCLKQAIEQKVVGPQRRDFLKNCMREE
jgi:hypothetical protein